MLLLKIFRVDVLNERCSLVENGLNAGILVGNLGEKRSELLCAMELGNEKSNHSCKEAINRFGSSE